MRIVCPSCSSAYDVPDSLVTAGRVVRCARCGNEWAPVEAAAAPEAEPVVAEPAPTPPVEPAPVEDVPAVKSEPRLSAMDRLALHQPPPPSRLSLRLAWAASIAILVMAAWGAYAWRGQIITAWPSSARMYAAFGLHSGTN